MPRENYTRYVGEKLTEMVKDHTYEIKDFEGNTQKKKRRLKEDIPPYFPSQGLIKAIEYARLLKRPLLLRGEPGCGKTRLAQALAFELYEKDYRNHYFEWYIKSTTKASDGLYHFDHLKRLRDFQILKNEDSQLDNINYRSFGPLGKAFISSTAEKPSILLIDEIDKADIDFPNDLLLELDQMRFFIEETNEEIVTEHPPIIIITSNDEKELPNAFLRRCVFHYIEFPGEEQLIKIAKSKANQLTELEGKGLPESLVEDIVKKFRRLFSEMKANPNTDKRPSTSELIDWLQVIHFYYLTDQLSVEKYMAKKSEDSDEEVEKYRLKSDQLLYPEVLLKTLTDYQAQTNK